MWKSMNGPHALRAISPKSGAGLGGRFSKNGFLGKASKRQNESWKLELYAINKDDHKFNFLLTMISKVCVALHLMRCSLSVIGESDPGPLPARSEPITNKLYLIQRLPDQGEITVVCSKVAKKISNGYNCSLSLTPH